MRTKNIFIITLLFALNAIAQAQDTMYIYKSGVVVTQRAVSQIDSIVFYNGGTTPQAGTVTDIDGNIYHTVTIGTQTWMVENLRTTRYNDGTNIPNVTNATEWTNLTSPGVCTFNNTNNIDTINSYGRLYNWYTVNTGKLAPTGWHVPTDAEWTVLSDYLGGDDVSGGHLKECGTAHWRSPNTGADNSSGFTGLPGGYRVLDGTFVSFGYFGYWWSSSEFSTSHAWFKDVNNDYSSLNLNYYSKSSGMSIRCIRDNER